MSTESLLLAIVTVLALIFVLSVWATLSLFHMLRMMRGEQQAMRRALANMDWTTVFSNMQAHAKESVRLLDILDKRLQKLEALEKIQVTQTNPHFRA